MESKQVGQKYKEEAVAGEAFEREGTGRVQDREIPGCLAPSGGQGDDMQTVRG